MWWTFNLKGGKDMRMQKSSRTTLAVLVVATVMLAVAGTAIASNMGFKLNKGLILAGTGQIGNNWTSIPYFNPYVTFGGFCTQAGLPSTGLTSARAALVDLNPNTGVFFSAVCGTTQATGHNLTPGWGVRIRPPASPAVNSIIIVGSHNPALSLNIPLAGAGQIGNLWFGVPYHTTAATAQDLCNSIGLVNSGVQRGQITRLNSTTGVFTTVSCGTSQAAGFTLTLGESVRIRQQQTSPTPTLPPGGVTFIPAHF
jgi:hypothetical protein